MMNKDNHFNMNDMRKMFDRAELWFSKANDRLGRLEEKHKMKSKSVNSTKKRIPIFRGMNNEDSYLKWEKEVEKVFACHNYSEEKKVRLASFSFVDHAALWWDKMLSSQRRYEVDPIVTWDEMKGVMRKRFTSFYCKTHKTILKFSTQIEKILDTDCQEPLIVRDIVDVIESFPSKEVSEKIERNEEDKREDELKNENKKNIDSSLGEIQEREKNDDEEEAGKENQINGPMESENQSEEIKCFDEKEESLIFTNTNNHFFSSDASLMQEHGYVFPKQEFVDHIDFVLGETFDSWERNELWQPRKLNDKLDSSLEHGPKMSHNHLKDSRTNLFEERGDDVSIGGAIQHQEISWSHEQACGRNLDSVENVSIIVWAKRGVFQHILGINFSSLRVGPKYYTCGDLFGQKPSYFGHTKLVKIWAFILDENPCFWGFIFQVH